MRIFSVAWPVLSSDIDDQAKSAECPYIPLLRLAEVWASDARLPVAMVLRHLCDWIMMEAFPAAALVTSAGDRVDPFDIFMSQKALGGRFGSFSFDGRTFYRFTVGARPACNRACLSKRHPSVLQTHEYCSTLHHTEDFQSGMGCGAGPASCPTRLPGSRRAGRKMQRQAIGPGSYQRSPVYAQRIGRQDGGT